MEPQIRVQVLDGKATLEIIDVDGTKRTYHQDELLRAKTYFESMIQKGQAGFDNVTQLLAHFENA